MTGIIVVFAIISVLTGIEDFVKTKMTEKQEQRNEAEAKAAMYACTMPKFERN